MARLAALPESQARIDLGTSTRSFSQGFPLRLRKQHAEMMKGWQN
jgi:hypothetical protein